MNFFLAGFGLLLHILFWGAGLALLLTPRPWTRYWPVFAAPAGLALQSAVVWWGAGLGLAGTNAYGWWCESLPVAALAAGLWARGWPKWTGLVADARRFGAVGIAMILTLGALLVPLAPPWPSAITWISTWRAPSSSRST